MGFPLYLSEQVLTEFAHRLNSALGVQVYARNVVNDTPASYVYFDTMGDAHDAAATIETNVGDLYILPTAGAGTTIVRSTDVVAQLEIEYDAANEVQFLVSATGDLNVTPSGGDVTITGNLVITGGLGLGGDLDMNGNDVNEVGTITGTTAAELGIYSKRQAVAAGAAVYTPGVGPGFADTVRLSIGAGAATVVVTWTAITHTGIVLSGSLDVNGQTLVNLIGLYSDANVLTVYTHNLAGIDTARLAISTGIDTAVITWSAITHTGIVLSGNLDVGNQDIVNLDDVYADANALTVYTHDVAGADTARVTIATGANVVAVTWVACTHTGMVLSGALDVNGQALQNLLGLYSDANILTIYTHNLAGADTPRLAISTGIDTAVVTWTAVTHTGVVLSGALDTNSQSLTNLLGLYSDANALTVYTHNAAGVDTARVAFATGANTVAVTWTACTHTGLVLGGSLDVASQEIHSILGLYSDANALTVYTHNLAGVDTARLSISTGINTAVVTWSAVTHTGIVLSGQMDCNSQSVINVGDAGNDFGASNTLVATTFSGTVDFIGNLIDNLSTIRSGANQFTLQTNNLAGVDATRLTITTGADIVVITWSNVTHTGIVLSGDLDAGAQDIVNLVGIYSDANTLAIYTHNLAGADTARLSISTGIDTAVATWSAMTHTGIVLSGALDANSQSLTNLLGLYSDANVLTIYTHNVGAVDTARMAVSTGVATAVVTWTVCTHTGIVLSGSFDADNQTITGISRIETDSILGVTKTVALDMPIGVGGAAAAELSWELLIDAVELAGLHAETDGAGTYRYPVFMIPYLAQATGVWANPNLPTGASNGALVLLYDSVLLQTRLYSYSGGAWVSVQLA